MVDGIYKKYSNTHLLEFFYQTDARNFVEITKIQTQILKMPTLKQLTM